VSARQRSVKKEWCGGAGSNAEKNYEELSRTAEALLRAEARQERELKKSAKRMRQVAAGSEMRRKTISRCAMNSITRCTV